MSNKTFLGLYTQDFLTSGQKKLQVALGTCQTICLCYVIATARLELFCQNLNKRYLNFDKKNIDNCSETLR